MKITGRTPPAGIIGWPVSHSLFAAAAWLLARRDGIGRGLCALPVKPITSSGHFARCRFGLSRVQFDRPAQAGGSQLWSIASIRWLAGSAP